MKESSSEIPSSASLVNNFESRVEESRHEKIPTPTPPYSEQLAREAIVSTMRGIPPTEQQNDRRAKKKAKKLQKSRWNALEANTSSEEIALLKQFGQRGMSGFKRVN